MSFEQTLLKVEGLELSRGRRRLAVSINFTLARGQFIELTGPNGSGKTTLLRVLAGLTAANRHARIECPPRSVFHFSARSGFRPELQVDAQLSMSLALFDPAMDAARSEQLFEQLLEQVGLSRHRHQRVGSLSEGQTRRLMLAVMMGSGRRLWLIDEPLNALDEAGVALLGRMLAQHLAAGGAAVVATHQSLVARLPDLTPAFAGRLQLSPKGSEFSSHQTAPCDAFIAAPPAVAGLSWVLRREFALLLARPQDALWPAMFHWMVVSLFPFALSADSALLARIGPGVFWVSSLLALLLASQRLFAADHDHGVLDQLEVAGASLELLAAGKIIASFLAVGLPLALASVPLGLQYTLDGHTLAVLVASLALGLPALTALCALFAALALMARQAQVVVSLMSLPCFVPVLIFGTAAAGSVQSGMSANAPLMVLAALAVLTLLALPWAAARVMRLAIN